VTCEAKHFKPKQREYICIPSVATVSGKEQTVTHTLYIPTFSNYDKLLLMILKEMVGGNHKLTGLKVTLQISIKDFLLNN